MPLRGYCLQPQRVQPSPPEKTASPHTCLQKGQRQDHRSIKKANHQRGEPDHRQRPDPDLSIHRRPTRRLSSLSEPAGQSLQRLQESITGHEFSDEDGHHPPAAALHSLRRADASGLQRLSRVFLQMQCLQSEEQCSSHDFLVEVHPGNPQDSLLPVFVDSESEGLRNQLFAGHLLQDRP